MQDRDADNKVNNPQIPLKTQQGRNYDRVMFFLPGIERNSGFPLLGWHEAAGQLRGALTPAPLILADRALQTVPAALEIIATLTANENPDIRWIEGGEHLKDATQVAALASSLSRRPEAMAVMGGGTLINFANALTQRLDQEQGHRIRYFVIPSTLLAVSDVALGSKGNLNQNGVKHKIRSYRDPDMIITDHRLIATLDPVEIKRGLVECYKHALLQDTAYPNGCDPCWPSLDTITMVLEQKRPAADFAMLSAFNTIFAKADILQKDPREEHWLAGLLSYGHLHAHAYEMASGFSLNHGDSVPFGMLVDLKLGGNPRLYHLALSHLSRTPLMDHLEKLEPAPERLKKAYHSETKKFFRPNPNQPEQDAFYVLPLRSIGEYRSATLSAPPPMLIRTFNEMQVAGKEVLSDLKAIKAHPTQRILHAIRAFPVSFL